MSAGPPGSAPTTRNRDVSSGSSGPVSTIWDFAVIAFAVFVIGLARLARTDLTGD